MRTVPQNYLGSRPVEARRELCKVWLQTGQCHRPLCTAAHCLNELSSNQLCRNIREKGYCQYDSSCQICPTITPRKAPLSPTARPVKVVLCQVYSQGGRCERGPACTFAHGMEELHVYRTRQVGYRSLGRMTGSNCLYCRFRTTGRLSARPGAPRASAGTGRPACTPTGTVS